MSSRPFLRHFFFPSLLQFFHPVAESSELRVGLKPWLFSPHCTCVTASRSRSGAIWRPVCYGERTKVSHEYGKPLNSKVDNLKQLQSRNELVKELVKLKSSRSCGPSVDVASIDAD